ncbi:MAG: glucosaminidase domain-containing protein [Candidatus Omnitrophica bacterium]|nr:glucosaminidase domain-containing protein [Candidatus Omnitrophota bacterium]
MIKRAFSIFVFIVLALFSSTKAAFAGDVAGSSAMPKKMVIDDQIDWRELKLYAFLKKKDSSLARYSADFIQAADAWGIDWRLLPAIAGLESSFAKRMVPGTYNAYGWGGGYIVFDNWADSIEHVSKRLREIYYDNGLITPTQIGPVYAPPNPRWGNLIASIINQI